MFLLRSLESVSSFAEHHETREHFFIKFRPWKLWRTHEIVTTWKRKLVMFWKKSRICCENLLISMFFFYSFCAKMWCFCCRDKALTSRTVWLGRETEGQKFPPNVIRNQKYSLFSFIPKVSTKIWHFVLKLSLFVTYKLL